MANSDAFAPIDPNPMADRPVSIGTQSFHVCRHLWVYTVTVHSHAARCHQDLHDADAVSDNDSCVDSTILRFYYVIEIRQNM